MKGDGAFVQYFYWIPRIPATGYQIRRAFIQYNVAAFKKKIYVLWLGPEHEQRSPPPHGPLINFKFLFHFPLSFLNSIWIFFLFLISVVIPRIPGFRGFRDSGIPAFCVFKITNEPTGSNGPTISNNPVALNGKTISNQMSQLVQMAQTYEVSQVAQMTQQYQMIQLVIMAQPSQMTQPVQMAQTY